MIHSVSDRTFRRIITRRCYFIWILDALRPRVRRFPRNSFDFNTHNKIDSEGCIKGNKLWFFNLPLNAGCFNVPVFNLKIKKYIIIQFWNVDWMVYCAVPYGGWNWWFDGGLELWLIRRITMAIQRQSEIKWMITFREGRESFHSMTVIIRFGIDHWPQNRKADVRILNNYRTDAR